MSSAGDTVSAAPAVIDSATKPAAEANPPPAKSAEDGNHVSASGDEPAAKKAKTVIEENGEVKEKTPKKKVSQLERTRAEAEALIGDLKKDGPESGGRRTRSQTRGTPAKSVVVPEKPARSPRTPKAKAESPAAAPKKATPAAGRSRGRPAKKATAAASDEENGAPAVTDAADAAAPADSKPEPVSEKAEPAVAENGQKSSDAQDSDAEKETTKEKTKEPEAEEKKEGEKVPEKDSTSASPAKTGTGEAVPPAAAATTTAAAE